MASDDLDDGADAGPGISLGLVVGVLLGAALALFVVQNTRTTRIKWLTFEVSQPLWVVLLATVAISFVIAALVGGARRRRKRKG